MPTDSGIAARTAKGDVISSRHRAEKTLVAVVVIGALFAACTSGPQAVCTAELVISISPRAKALSVGESLQPKVRLTTCGGRQVATDQFTWTSSNPEVVVVVLGSTLRAVRAGSTAVSVEGRRYGVLGSIAITVGGSP